MIADRFLIAAAICGLLMGGASGKEAESERAVTYSSAFAGYANAATQRSFGFGGLVFRTDSHQVISGERVYPYSHCENALLKFCIDSEIFKFAIPKNVTEGQQWSVGDVEFRVAREKRIWLRSRTVTAYDIQSRYAKSGYKVWFVYTSEYGLVAIARWPELKLEAEDIVRGVLYLNEVQGLGAVRS